MVRPGGARVAGKPRVPPQQPRHVGHRHDRRRGRGRAVHGLPLAEGMAAPVDGDDVDDGGGRQHGACNEGEMCCFMKFKR